MRMRRLHYGLCCCPEPKEEPTSALDAEPLIVEAWQAGEIPKHEAEDELDARENAK